MRVALRVVLAAWLGVLLSIAALVTPVLFAVLADRHLAGVVAGQLFSAVTWASIVVAAALTVMARRLDTDARRVDASMAYLAPVACLVISQWGVRPMLELARATGGSASGPFLLWHGVSTLLYAAATATAWVLGLAIREFGR